MATRRVEIGTTGEQLRTNLRRLRGSRGWKLADVATRMTEAGRPMAVNTISEIENGARRVDVDDLTAFAHVFGVDPNSLLLPEADVQETLRRAVHQVYDARYRRHVAESNRLTGLKIIMDLIRQRPGDVQVLTAAVVDVWKANPLAPAAQSYALLGQATEARAYRDPADDASELARLVGVGHAALQEWKNADAASTL